MLSANEFTVGSLADAQPLSLMLPRNKHEEAVLVGLHDNSPTAVILSGQHKFSSFVCSEGGNWKGLLIANVKIEVDEASLFDPQYSTPQLGTIVRSKTELVLKAKLDDFSWRGSSICLEMGLSSTHDVSAAFSRWQIVIGEGLDKRVMYKIDTSQDLEQ